MPSKVKSMVDRDVFLKELTDLMKYLEKLKLTGAEIRLILFAAMEYVIVSGNNTKRKKRTKNARD